MLELIDKHAAYKALKHEAETHGLSFSAEAYDRAARIIDQMPTIHDIDRAAILRLCNEIDDILTLLYAYCHIDHYQYNQIHSKLDAIGKELNGDAGTDD